MASYDRKFSVIQPGIDRLQRTPLEVADLGLVNPTGTSPVPLIDGELVTFDTSFKWARATDAAIPSFFVIEDRGDYGVQVSRKMSALTSPGMNFMADTIVYNTGLTTLGTKVMLGSVSNSLSGSVTRSGLIAFTAGVCLGYVIRTPATNGGLLRIISALA
jgi:hypothetical protein